MTKTHFETVRKKTFEQYDSNLESARAEFAKANFSLALGLDLTGYMPEEEKQKEQTYQYLISEDVATRISDTITEVTDEDGLVEIFSNSGTDGYKLSVINELSLQVGSMIYQEHQLRLRQYYQDIIEDENMSDATRDMVYDLFYGETAETNKTINHGLDEDALKVNISLSAFASESAGRVSAEKLVEKIKSIVHTCAGVTDPYGELLWLRDVVRPAKLVVEANNTGFFGQILAKVLRRN